MRKILLATAAGFAALVADFSGITAINLETADGRSFPQMSS